MRTDRRDRCTEILDLIDRCLAEVEADRVVGHSFGGAEAVTFTSQYSARRQLVSVEEALEHQVAQLA